MASEILQLKKSTVKITAVALLAALSVIFQISPPLLITPWFMRVDLVAVPWVICWILFGFKAAIICSAITLPLVAYIGPFAGGWVGGVMKFVASVWMFIIPALFVHRRHEDRRSFIETKWLFMICACIAIIVRDIATLFFNFYFALPFFYQLSTEKIIWFFSQPQYISPISYWLGVVGLVAFFVEIVFWNSIQGAIDMFASWVLGLAILRRFYPKQRKES